MAHVPDLSVKGWITNPMEKADKLMAHFYAAEHSQSNLFPNDVHSFVYILQKNLNQPTELRFDLEQNLRTYFNKYFLNTVVDVTLTDIPGSASKQNVNITMAFESADGQRWDLSNVAEINGSLFERYSHYNNTGNLIVQEQL